MKIKCDRCGDTIEGYIDDTSSSGGYVTSGGYWKKVADAKLGEDFICDLCMWKTPGYIKNHCKINLD